MNKRTLQVLRSLEDVDEETADIFTVYHSKFGYEFISSDILNSSQVFGVVQLEHLTFQHNY